MRQHPLTGRRECVCPAMAGPFGTSDGRHVTEQKTAYNIYDNMVPVYFTSPRYAQVDSSCDGSCSEVADSASQSLESQSTLGQKY